MKSRNILMTVFILSSITFSFHSASAGGPTENLWKGLIAWAKNGGKPLETMAEVLKLKPDEHGNIWFGLDNSEFSYWKKFEKYVPTALKKKAIGPYMIPTNPKVIDKLLMELKSGSDEHFAGNRSTDIVGGLMGHENAFAPGSPEIHKEHKLLFKNFIGNQAINAQKLSPIIKSWIYSHLKNKTIADDSSIEDLTAKLMLRMLVDSKAAESPDLVQAIIGVKTHFIKRATYKTPGFAKYFNGYEEARKALFEAMALANIQDQESYPRYLTTRPGNPMSIEQAQKHIMTFMMVGFDNLQSAMMSQMVQLAKNPNFREILKKESVEKDGYHFLHFDSLHAPKDRGIQFAPLFFKETLRLTPPVWMQARKNHGQELKITYKVERKLEKEDEKNKEKERIDEPNREMSQDTLSFNLPSSTTVLIPVYHLARNFEDGNEFSPNRENPPRFYPFSTGPNACPGQGFAYSALGVLMAELIRTTQSMSLAKEPVFDPKVALKWKDVQLQFVPIPDAMESLKDQNQPANSEYTVEDACTIS